MSEKVAQPKAAQHQVWRLGDGSKVVLGDEESPGMFRTDRSMVANFDLCGREYGWSCIGLVTPHGRVMVGERRRYGSHEAIVVRVMDDAFVQVSPPHPSNGHDLYLASGVVRWPLISPPTHAEPQTWDTVTIGGVSYPAKEIRYEAEGGEESASTRVILGIRGNVAFTMTLAPEEAANAGHAEGGRGRVGCGGGGGVREERAGAGREE